MIFTVALSDRAVKDLRKCPQHIVRNLMAWVGSVELEGLEEIRRLPGYHDEPLRGEWEGHRSIRLSRAYRAIYVIRPGEKNSELVRVETVNKHRY